MVIINLKSSISKFYGISIMFKGNMPYDMKKSTVQYFYLGVLLTKIMTAP